jgi:hypothetical protein
VSFSIIGAVAIPLFHIFIFPVVAHVMSMMVLYF